MKPDRLQSQLCADQLKALADPLRLRIVDLLRQGELTVGDLAQFLDVELGTASHHLAVLKNASIVTDRRDGRFKIYRLRDQVLQSSENGSTQFLNLGCCRIEVPPSDDA